MTTPLAKLILPDCRGHALVAIKAIHTAIFFSLAAAILLTVWDGLRGQPQRRTAVAGGMVLAETAAYISNNQVCPLTPLAEQLGASRGSVVDIFLPAWAASRIPVVAGSAAVLALVLNLSAWRNLAHRQRGDQRMSVASWTRCRRTVPRWMGSHLDSMYGLIAVVPTRNPPALKTMDI